MRVSFGSLRGTRESNPGSPDGPLDSRFETLVLHSEPIGTGAAAPAASQAFGRLGHPGTEVHRGAAAEICRCAARVLLLALLIFRVVPSLSAIEIPASVKVLSPDSYKAFGSPFPRVAAAALRAKDENTGGTRLAGEGLRVCAELLGFGTVIEQLEGDNDGCFAVSRFRWDARSDAFLLRGPGAYESNSRFLLIVQGRTLVSLLEVASGMGDAGGSVAVESLISDLDGDGALDVLTRTVTTHDPTVGLTEPDTVVFTFRKWRGDHFEERPLGKADPLAAAFSK